MSIREWIKPWHVAVVVIVFLSELAQGVDAVFDLARRL